MTQLLHAQLIAELQRRATLLTRELEQWTTLTVENVDGMGIHQSQIEAINLMFDVFAAKQARLLAALNPALAADEFAQRREDLEQELTGSHGIIAVFRYILAQRQDPQYYGKALDAADLIAAMCYRPCILRARQWGVLTRDQFREPPLTYLNAMFSPMAITRRHRFSAFKLPIDDSYETQKLPISVLSLPFHYTEAIWTFCSLYHEVGHPLDQDLGLKQSLLEPLRQQLEAEGVAVERLNNWTQNWLHELIADAFGVILGGAAYTRALTHILFLPVEEVTKIDSQDSHPNHYVRIFLLSALLRTTQISSFVDVATELEETWRQIYGEPAALMPYLPDCATVAQVLLRQPLTALDSHCLYDFAFDWSGELNQIERLATYLRTEQDRPDPLNFAVRLVPAAAQTAAQSVIENHAAAYEKIHRLAMQFISETPRPESLGPANFTPTREAYLRSLVENLDFGRADES